MLENLQQKISKSAKPSDKGMLIDSYQPIGLAFLLISGIFSPTVFAGMELSPYVDMTVMQDDNLYRLDSAINIDALNSSISKEDTLYQLEAGMVLDWMLSRQNIQATASVTDNQFKNNSRLDYVGHALGVKWDWMFGHYLTGQLSWNQKQTLNDFSNTSVREGSQKDEERMGFLAKWHYAPDWEAGAKLLSYRLRYDLQALQPSDRDSMKTSVFVNYFTHSGNRMGVTLAQEIGKYPGRELTALSVIDNEYQQNSLLFNVDWQVTVKSKLSLDMGWNARVHPNLSARDYDGLNTKIGYTWLPTAKTLLEAKAYRQLTSSSYVDSTFSENTGYILSAAWKMSEKLSFNGRLKHEIKDYIGQVDDFNEQYDTFSLGGMYQPYSMLDVSLQWSQNLRESTQNLRDYQSQSVVLDVKLKF